jgi:hypothetical protein
MGFRSPFPRSKAPVESAVDAIPGVPYRGEANHDG